MSPRGTGTAGRGVAALLAVFAVACDPVFAVHGTVSAPDGSVLEGAEVELQCPRHTQGRSRTNARGEYALSGIGCMTPSCAVLVRVDGGVAAKAHVQCERPRAGGPCGRRPTCSTATVELVTTSADRP